MEDSALTPYSQKELKTLAKAFSLMGDEAISQARTTSNGLAEFAFEKIKTAAYGRQFAAKAIQRVINGGKVSKTSKTGLISIGFAGQRFSGGATTKILWPGYEFGTNRLKQFPNWSGKYGRGSRGWFIYPTLRRIQPELTKKWIAAVDQIVKKWKN